MYLLIKYIKSVLWKVVKHMSYIEDARCLKVNKALLLHIVGCTYYCISDARSYKHQISVENIQVSLRHDNNNGHFT